MTAILDCSKIVTGYHDITWYEKGGSAFVTLGSTGPDGFRRVHTLNFKEVAGDAYGPETVLDHIYRGGNCVLEFTLQEYARTDVLRFLGQFQTATPADKAKFNRIGQPGVSMAAARAGYLKLTPRTGSTAAASGLYENGDIVAEAYFGMYINPITTPMDLNERFIPITFQCYPFAIADDAIAGDSYEAEGTIGWWSRITQV